MKKALFKIGDKVKIRKDFNKDTEDPCGVGINDSMVKQAGKIFTIRSVNKNSTGYVYKLLEDENLWNWGENFFYKQTYNDSSSTKKETEEEDSEEDSKINKDEEILKAFKSINDNIKALSKNFDKKTIYEETLRDKMLERIKKDSMLDLDSEIKDKIDSYIEKNYKVLPKVIEIQKGAERRHVEGLFHNKFEEILKIVEKGIPLMLTGPAGAGKNHTLEQVAKALGLHFYFSNAVTQEFQLTGFKDASGAYQDTQFYQAWTDKEGALFFLDEMDGSNPEALLKINCAIANGYFDFPTGKIDMSPNFRIVCAGNTYGTGADNIYVGRNQLDGATLDRFAVIEFDYDSEIEKQLAYDSELFDFIVDLRRAVKEASLRYIVSMRATINASKMLEIGLPKKDILTSAIIKNMQVDDLNVIVKKINKSNSWGKILNEIAEERSKMKV